MKHLLILSVAIPLAACYVMGGMAMATLDFTHSFWRWANDDKN